MNTETRIRAHYRDAAGVMRTLHASDAGYRAGPEEGHATYVDDLRVRPAWTRTIGAGLDPDPADTAYSAITLGDAASGRYDALREAAWGYAVAVLEGPRGRPTAEFAVVMTGIVERADVGWRDVDLILRDRLQALRDRPITEATLAGTATAGGRTPEGGPSLADRPVPIGWGVVEAIPPVEGNVHDETVRIGPYHALTGVADMGAPLTVGAMYPDWAALQAATLAPGTVAGCPAEGLIRTESPPVGALLVSARFQAVSTLPALVRAVLEGPGGLAPADILASVDALPAWDAGWWTGAEAATVGDVLDGLLSGVGYWHDDALGRIGAWRPTPPELAAATVALTADDLAGAPELVATGLEVPAGRLEVEYRRAWTVLSEDQLVPADTPARLAWRDLVTRETRLSARDSAAVQARWPAYRTVPRTTALASAADAAVLAGDLEGLFGAPRRAWRLGTTREAARLVDLGTCVDLSAIPRLGLTRAWVVGLRRRPRPEITVWG
ncbi:hypothetical protein [Roseospira goensis]|uniref:Uncharacterized protein n=1 Tax=Roseospira goensis TaxID=391922 RepID=A0A7W6WMI1_9PROT|nr:hypothetical protein [Roseospira goensis]MBB4287522.1 hypothetical protein [Roseospira goensis]